MSYDFIEDRRKDQLPWLGSGAVADGDDHPSAVAYHRSQGRASGWIA
jgi:hypothetical protein